LFPSSTRLLIPHGGAYPSASLPSSLLLLKIPSGCPRPRVLPVNASVSALTRGSGS